jgi:hypothetical protein
MVRIPWIWHLPHRNPHVPLPKFNISWFISAVEASDGPFDEGAAEVFLQAQTPTFIECCSTDSRDCGSVGRKMKGLPGTCQFNGEGMNT